MNTKSIRFRLTLWYTAAFCAAAAVIFVTFYLVTRQALFAHTDSQLIQHSGGVVSVVARNEALIHQMVVRDVFLNQFSEAPEMLVVILDHKGNVVTSSITIKPAERAFISLFSEAQQKKEKFFQNQTVGTATMRFLVSPIIQDGTIKSVVLMGHPLDVIQNSLSSLFTTLAIVFILFVLGAIAGGYLLANRALAPLMDLSQTLTTITAKNLNDRLTPPKTGDEFERLYHSFNSLLDRLHASFTRERQFIADVAHELKTPLTTTRTGIEVALTKPRTTEEYKRVLTESLIDTKHIANTLNNILDLARSSAEGAAITSQRFSLTECLSELVQIAKKLASNKNITVSSQITSNIIIAGDREKLFRAILAVIDNAVKYSPPSGRIEVTLKRKGKSSAITIKDTGMGIPKGDLSHIFERFFRGTKAGKTTGAGLGLAITKSIIEAHSGTITVISQHKKGTMVQIVLPIA